MSGAYDWGLRVPSTQPEQFYYRVRVLEEISLLSPEFVVASWFPCVLSWDTSVAILSPNRLSVATGEDQNTTIQVLNELGRSD